MGLTRSRIILLGALLFLILGSSYYLAQGENGKSSREMGRARTIPVITETVVLDEFVDAIEAIGTARSNESVVISAKVTETLTSTHFEDGQYVEAGSIIAELTDIEASADLAEAKASLEETEKQFERISNLVKRGSSTQANLDTAKSNRDKAIARVEALEARLADRLIRAPFSGVLGLRLVSPGTLVRPGDEITTLDDISIIKLDFSVPETFLGALQPGLEVKAKSAAFPKTDFLGRVSAIDTRVNPGTRAVMIRAEIPNPDGLLKPGMLLTTTVINNRRKSMMIPEEAVVPLREETYVFVVRNGERGATVDMVSIKLGGRTPGKVEVLSGLELGEEVVTQGTNRVKPGTSVNVLNAKERPNA